MYMYGLIRMYAYVYICVKRGCMYVRSCVRVCVYVCVCGCVWVCRWKLADACVDARVGMCGCVRMGSIGDLVRLYYFILAYDT